MYDISTRNRALALVAQGRSLNSVSRETGISRAAIRSWQERLEPLPRMVTPAPGPPTDECAYAYLLGLYLGDGCISAHPRGTGYYLRIACADAWPGLLQLAREAITQVRPGIGVYTLQKQGCSMVTSYFRHWPSLFPQHGPGKKHERHIALEPWQQTIVDAHPWDFIRGLIHSDGCRITNWTTRVVAGERKRYEYPRYFFTNL
uniref:helix-turn-helix domain-containing protein n=1 Tax=Streptomyces adelaidensis TaxID=2796465 RepID=UPI00190662BB